MEGVHISMCEKSGGQEKGLSTSFRLRSVRFTRKTSCVHASTLSVVIRELPIDTNLTFYV